MKIGKRTILYKYIVSSLTLIIVFFIPLCFFAFQSIISVKENTINYVHDMLKQKQEIIDLHMEKLNSLVNDLSLNARIVSYAYASPRDSAFYDKMRLSLTELSRAKATNDFIYEIALFHHKGGKLLISSGVYDQQNMQQLVMPFEGVSFEEWEKEIIQRPAFAPARNLSISPSTGILCAYSTFPNYERANQAAATLILMIDANKLSDILRERNTADKSAVYILDQNGTVLLSTGESGFQIKDLPERNEEDTFTLHTKLQGEKLFHFGISSSLNNWTYVFSTAENSLFSSANNVRKSMVALLGGLIVFGIFLCIAQVRSHYFPIRSTVMQLEQAGAGEISGNEIQYISTAIDRQVQKIDDLSSRVNSYLPILRSSIRYQMLYGEFENTSELSKALSELSIHFSHPGFCVILADIEMVNEDSDVSPSVLKLSYKETADKLFRQYGSAHALSVGVQRMAIVLNVEHMEDPQFQALMENLLTKIKDHLMAEYDASIIVGVSSLLPGPENIHSAYLEAQGALEYYNYNPTNWIYFWKVVNGYDEFETMDTISDKQLLQAIKSGNREFVEKELNHYLQNFSEIRHISPQTARYIFYRLMGNIQHMLLTLDGDLDESFQQSEPMQSLLACKSMPELIAVVKRISLQLCDSFHAKYQGYGGELVERLKRYITDNHADMNLSLSSVADYFKLTPTYIAHILRQHGNTTFLELLRKERIQHAKQLLADTDSSINDIARSVGYGDSIALGRNFKKELQITPGQFREQNS